MGRSPRDAVLPSARWMLVAVANVAACSAVAEGAPAAHYEGVAYAADGGEVRYREEHWLFEEHDVRERLILYRCPSGEPFARKELRYDGTRWAPTLTFEDARSGYKRSVRKVGGDLKVTSGVAGNDRSAMVKLTPDTVVDAGFDDFVRAHWTSVNRPDGMKARFVMIDRMESYSVILKPRGTADASDDIRHYRLRLDGLLGTLAPSVDIAYSASDRFLTTFEGTSDIRDARGKSQRVRIRFDASGKLASATAEEITEARRLTLVSSCRG